jgi:hypothetical protein
MKLSPVLALCFAVVLPSFPSHASPWVSLGRLDALKKSPQVEKCDQRFLNHYWTPATIFMPTAKTKFSSTEMNFRFSMDLLSLSNFIEAPTLLSALSLYNGITTAKDLSAEIDLGNYPNVSVNVSQLRDDGTAQADGFGINRSLLGYYEIQESC